MKFIGILPENYLDPVQRIIEEQAYKQTELLNTVVKECLHELGIGLSKLSTTDLFSVQRFTYENITENQYYYKKQRMFTTKHVVDLDQGKVQFIIEKDV